MSPRWRWQSFGGAIALVVLLIFAGRLGFHAQQPPDALLVLGGSIRREMWAAERLQAHPGTPLLISSGAPAPCVALLFEHYEQPETIWLETCAHSTFENFVYTTPILRNWRVRHVQLITSASHLPRALWLARIHLGIHGIWVSLDVAPETGQPGNVESGRKTVLDVARSLGWALVSWVYQPHCEAVRSLTTVDLEQALRQGFHCEHQAQLDAIIEHRQQELRRRE